MFRYFEVNDTEPYVHYLNMYQSQQSQRGLGYMPKRGCEFGKNEIARFCKLHPTKVEPISFTVPRKAETFQKDLYPPTASTEPALTAEEWIQGLDKDPVMMDITPNTGIAKTEKEFQVSQNRVSTLLSAPSTTNSRPVSQISNGGNGNCAAQVGALSLPDDVNIEELLEDIKKLKATVRKQGRRIAKLEAKAQAEG
jgi:hypothetical protein